MTEDTDDTAGADASAAEPDDTVIDDDPSPRDGDINVDYRRRRLRAVRVSALSAAGSTTETASVPIVNSGSSVKV